ncbi:MAG: hypothetical protein IJL54_01690 [Prevotella sp.]|nr:hypothetical protein [Prevotella sp.]
METKQTMHKWTQEDFLALLKRGREIKARRQKEADEWYAERLKKQQEAAKSGYYNIEWG